MGWPEAAVIASLVTIFIAIGAWKGKTDSSDKTVQRLDEWKDQLQDKLDARYDLRYANKQLIEYQLSTIKESQLRNEELLRTIVSRLSKASWTSDT